jgi:CheY-like chemotaxis protein
MTLPGVLLPSIEQLEAFVNKDPVKKKRVLLVDTNRVKRGVRADTMKRLGMDVDSAADISEARCCWRPDLYDLVLFHVEDEPLGRDTFCTEIRGIAPGQQIAFFVGGPRFLADLPNVDGALAIHEDEVIAPKAPTALEMQASVNPPPAWGILEACRRISTARSVASARTKALRERPLPPRDLETVAARRTLAQWQAKDDPVFGEPARKETL